MVLILHYKTLMVLQVVDFGCAEQYILMVLILHYKTSMVLQVVDFGCAECNFQKYLRNIERVEEVSCIDVNGDLLRCFKHKTSPKTSDYIFKRYEFKLSLAYDD